MNSFTRMLMAGIMILGITLACGGSDLSPTPTQTPEPSATSSPVPTLTPTPLPPLAFYFTDAFEPRSAKIYKMENGRVSVYFERARGGQIYSFNFGPDGTLYLVDANSFRLAMIVDGKETRFFTHTTYIRHIEFDSHGTMYFSEATGAGGDGKIYVLDGTTAHLFYTVKLTDVDGYWFGSFAFDKNDNLWLSSGNIIPSHLYKVQDGVPDTVLTFREEPMVGFFFLPGGHLVVANWITNVHRYTGPDFRSRETFTVPDAVHVADVAPLSP